MLQENKKNSNPKISSRTSLFWTLPEQLSKLHRAFPQICPKPLLQEKTKPQTPRFLLAHPCFELCQNSSPSYTAHFPKSVQNHCCKKKQQNLKPQDFFSHIPILNSARTALQVTPRISANLSWANVPKKRQNLRPQDFISPIPVCNSAGAALQVTARISPNLSWANVPKKTQNLRPQDFISHIPVFNSARTALQVTPRISANLS